jgi:hypothetical protein
MLRILFDKNVPYLLRRHLIEYQAQTADDEGWGHIQYQQNMARRKISMVVLGSNIWPSIRPKIAEIAAALKRVSPGSFEFIEIAPPPKRRRLGDPSKHAPRRAL